MAPDAKGRKRATSRILFVVALIGLAAGGCSNVRPGPDAEQGGLIESPTHEADAVRRAEQRQEQNRGGGGGGY